MKIALTVDIVLAFRWSLKWIYFAFRWSIIANGLKVRWSLFWPALCSVDRSSETVWRGDDRHFLPRVDHWKQFDGQMIALLTGTFFRWSIIGNSLAGRWSALSAEGWSLETVWQADDRWIVDLVNWSSYYVTSALTVALSTRSTIFQSINLKSIVKKWTEDSRLPSGLTLGSFHFLTRLLIFETNMRVDVNSSHMTRCKISIT